MRPFAFFLLLSSAVAAALPLPALAAQDKKELSEEEEIAQMMDQLEQFKASWESKDQSAKAGVSNTASQPSTEKTDAANKPIVILPASKTPQQRIPSIKRAAAQIRTLPTVPACALEEASLMPSNACQSDKA